ncbi:MAG: GNAT family N-acetyltransferase, partial [Bacteroidales bacterium]|nr:GNAT family N-acetyltransferase [Bacteroidales bacterium]
MKTIIPPVDKNKLRAELNEDTFLRNTNKGSRELYVITAHDSPNVMNEIGRLRELTFRAAGGGTGKPADIDKYDLAENPFKQLVVWDPTTEEIVGGYRYIEGYNIEKDETGHPISATSKLFNFTDKFNKEYLPYTIELGRSFVCPEYQPTVNLRKGMYSLDNLWDGLGAVSTKNPDIK